MGSGSKSPLSMEHSGLSHRTLDQLVTWLFFLVDYIIDLTAITSFQTMINRQSQDGIISEHSLTHFATYAVYFWTSEYVCHYWLPRFPSQKCEKEAEMLQYGSAENDVASSLATKYTTPRVALMLALGIGYCTRWGFLGETSAHTIPAMVAWSITRMLWTSCLSS